MVCIIAFTVLVMLGVRELSDRKGAEDFYEQARLEAQQTVQEPVELTVIATPSPAPVLPDATVLSEPEATPAPTPVPTAQPASMDFKAMKKKWKDVRGWIRIPDTVIDYPIVQGKDNIYYLNHMPNGADSASGAIFIDSSNAPDFSDTSTTIHGHHLKSGKMFGSLERFNEEAYYREHPYVELYTPSGDYTCAIFACRFIDANTFSYPASFLDQADFESFIASLKAETPYVIPVDPKYGDRIILLSTCAYVTDNARFLVAAVLNPDR